MTEIDSSPEALKGEDWAGEMGAKWLANLERFEGMIAPIGEALLKQADYKHSERVLDIGCGGGGTTIAIAQAVAPSGEVLGIDISPDLTTAATQRANDAGVSNIRFICADASTVQFDDKPFDRLFSRFGSMFFPEPHKAFANLHSLLRPSARIDLAVWGPPRDNLWMMEMMSIVRRYVDIPPAVPRTPGPFAFEDLDYLNEILASGGFSNVNVSAYQGLQPIGGVNVTPQDAVSFILSSMAVGRALDEQGADVRSAAEADLIELFQNHYEAGRGVMMQGKAWLASAIA
ncbi:MAG TPA: methyltransferase domain-containing protein [Sphingorhabdus sp.]|jgi:ubiquinone/menaquinone biosynthesis C-methylase UbiE|uniref:class I SAM-dependent methyltransferase n=1 Tax=Sphingorhabdus sp. TaxID=1902408 RepID=UPI002B8CC5EC|nr:methyltransferase domain-containing protein [Sphingorhabdus sp.]MBK7162401.1 methyltransferase domain-containing protein [Sphingomonadales bacterium]HMT41870.1 methyltransferase domain-containing protein [Sphingorhabdus sp.]HMU21499.1 methyltransferase domain-containing protein [Sphingorhabdus sp.]